MSILKVLKSNNFVFFVISLILMGFAVHSLSKRKNNIVDSLVGHADLKPYHIDDMSSNLPDINSGQLMDDSDFESEGSEGSAPSMQRKAVARVSSTVPKPVHTDPKELLPNDKGDSFHNKDLINAGRFISQQSEVLRNANLQIRSDPPVGRSQTGPWNQTTITPDTLRPQFELSGSSGTNSVAGFRKQCPGWMSSSPKNSNAILPPQYQSVSSE